MALQFHMTPGSCTTGIHILLEEMELPFQVNIVHLQAGDHRQPAYLAINPKGAIPTLVLNDGSSLTSFPSIAVWLALRHPRERMLSDEPLLAARTIDLMDFVVGTVHGQRFTRIFTTDRYLPEGLTPADTARWNTAIQAQGRRTVQEAFDVIEAGLPEAGYAMGADFGIADAALFYVLFWASKTQTTLPPRCQALFERIRARPVVQQVLREGIPLKPPDAPKPTIAAMGGNFKALRDLRVGNRAELLLLRGPLAWWRAVDHCRSVVLGPAGFDAVTRGGWRPALAWGAPDGRACHPFHVSAILLRADEYDPKRQ